MKTKTLALVTFTENPDGSVTTEFDPAPRCERCKWWAKSIRGRTDGLPNDPTPDGGEWGWCLRIEPCEDALSSCRFHDEDEDLIAHVYGIFAESDFTTRDCFGCVLFEVKQNDPPDGGG